MQAQHRPFRNTLALALVLGVTACAGGSSGAGRVYYTNFTAGYVPSSVAAAHPLLVETYGSPTPGATEARVTEASVRGLRKSGPPWMPRGYTDNPENVPSPAYRLRIAYAVPKKFNGQELCKTTMSAAALEAARDQADEGATRTIAGLCRGERAVAYAEGSPGGASDIDGERFDGFLGLLGRQLMPRRNPVTRDDCVFRFCD